MGALPEIFLRKPIAHRGYHARAEGRIENSPAAISAAIDAGYNIEIDVQLSADGQAIVFHDYDLARLTEAGGRVRDLSAQALGETLLKGSDDRIPTLAQVLDLVADQVGILIEIKDQDGEMGPKTGALEAAVLRDLAGYRGPVAVMSFNPHSVGIVHRAAPDLAVGLTTSAYLPEHWPEVPEGRRAELRLIADYAAVGASFISHEAADLGAARVAELKAAGAVILCWTIRSAEAEARARRVADNVTFENYPA